MITGRRAVAVVARREILVALRQRSLIISTVITVAILAGVLFLPSAFGGGDPEATILHTDRESAAVVATARDGQKAFEVRIKPRAVADAATAHQRLRDGEADVAVVDRAGRILVRAGAPDRAVAAVQAASRSARAAAALASRGVTGPDAAQVLAPRALPATEIGDDDDAAKGVAFLAMFILYGQLIVYGTRIAMGVVEEKASRIVELLLSAIRPRDLLAGKIAGVGLVGLAQLVVVGACGIALGAAAGRLEVGGSGVPLAVLVTLLWFLLGYALYACAYAVAGALVSRQEEIQSTTTPLTIAIIGSFFLGLQAISSPDGPLATVLSMVPVSAPLVMPVRMITGSAGVVEVLAAIALVLACVAALVVVGGRIYAGAVLRTGGRVRIATALRGS